MERRTFLATSAAALAAGPAWAETLYRGYEMPRYRILWADGPVELREYAPFLSAEVLVRGTRWQAASTGFRSLAGYIFGGNATGEKIAMTVPVTQVPRDGDVWTVAFMVPAEYERDTLPTPKAEEIRFVDHPGGQELVLRFSGIYRHGRLGNHVARLQQVAAARGLVTSDAPKLYFYDDPMTLPWRRRNEVALPVI